MGSDLSISILVHLVQDSLYAWQLLPHTAQPIQQGKTCCVGSCTERQTIRYYSGAQPIQLVKTCCVGPCTERQTVRSLQWSITLQPIQQGKKLLCGALHRKTDH